MTDKNCAVCGNKMHEIPDYARTKPEGAAAYKGTGKSRYQCMTESCTEHLKVVE